MRLLAILRLLEILGEAAKHVSEKTRAVHPEIPWRAIAGARDRLIHGYFAVDLAIIAQIIQVDIPDLTEKLKGILEARGV